MAKSKLLVAAQEIQDFCERLKWKFCIIGGLAVQRWAEPRLTQDIDLTVITGFGLEERFIDALLQQFKARRGDAKEFALSFRVLLLEASNGVPLDISLGAMPFEENIIKRATKFQYYRNIKLLTCSAEDLIILKAFANRAKDWIDIDSTLKRQAEKLNIAIIREELAPLIELKEEPEILERLEMLLKSVVKKKLSR